MNALDYLKIKFPLWDTRDILPLNTVSLLQEDLIEAMEEFSKQEVEKAVREKDKEIEELKSDKECEAIDFGHYLMYEAEDMEDTTIADHYKAWYRQQSPTE